MRKNKSSISKAASYRDLGKFWDAHDLAEFWDKTKDADFDVRIDSEKTFFEVDQHLSSTVQEIARKHRVSAGRLVNSWLREKLEEEKQRASRKVRSVAGH